jgi:nucleoside-diphosphate-sugar epimerase
VTDPAKAPRILVTGGSGFIGSRLALLASQLGHAPEVVTAINNAAERERCDELAKSGVHVTEASIEDASAMSRALAGCDAVIHLAAAQHEAGRPESYFQQINVEGTRRLLQLAAGAGIRRFVHGSTIGVYGSAADGVLDEHSPLAPDNAYGRTKAAAEAVVRDGHADMEYCIVRISETYGPGDMRLLKLFRGVRSGRYLTVGDGENEHQLIYVDDLIRGLLAACQAPAANGATIVLAGAERLTTNAMVAAIGAAVGNPRRVPHAPLWPFIVLAYAMERTLGPLGVKPPLHRRRLDFFRKSFRFSTAAAERLLGFRAETPFAEGAGRTAQWYRSRGLLG